ncbi:hypothetical protein GCM10023215_14670 [Pseudonocardia yuanmonensis]|uniref:Uncharacterized protein n=1 Tax=Pseudonocardia yuanmonensis TaxID=1095914 RepID=A0ABP8W6V0_9PSEU
MISTPVRFAEVLDHEPAQFRGDPVGVPAGPVEQVLHPVRAGLPGVFGDAPTVLAGQLGEHPAHEPGDALPGVDPAEPTGDPVEEPTFPHRPRTGLQAVARGHRIVLSPHNPR